MAKILEIRNSTAEFLTFLAENKEDGVQVVYKDENIWATQTAMAELFDCSSDNIGLHLKNIYADGELHESATAEKISVVQLEGTRKVNREPTFYRITGTASFDSSNSHQAIMTEQGLQQYLLSNYPKVNEGCECKVSISYAVYLISLA